jgi:hypothetical protein
MKSGVVFGEAPGLDGGVDLRRGKARVAEHFLDGAEIGAAAQQMGGEGMPQEVRLDGLRNAGQAGVFPHEHPEHDARQGASAI